MSALRARIARLYAERHGVEVAAERIVVTTGSSAAFVLAFLAVFDAGDAVALPSPGYPCYRHILTRAGAAPGAADDGTGDATGCRLPRDVARAAERDGIEGAADRQPRQSHRHHD